MCSLRTFRLGLSIWVILLLTHCARPSGETTTVESPDIASASSQNVESGQPEDSMESLFGTSPNDELSFLSEGTSGTRREIPATSISGEINALASSSNSNEVVEVIPIYRAAHLNPAGVDYFYSTSKESGVSASYTWNSTPIFKTLRKRVSEDQVQLIQCYNGSRHYLTTEDLGSCGSVPVDRFLGFIFRSQVADTLVLDQYSHRYFGGYLATLHVDLESKLSGVFFERRLGYAINDTYSGTSYQVTVSNASVASTQNIYRATARYWVDVFFSTTDEASTASVRPYYLAEGVKFKTYTRQMDLDMIQLVQCYSTYWGHYLSAWGCGAGRALDRNLGYIYYGQTNGTVALYNYYSSIWRRFLAATDTVAPFGFAYNHSLGWVVSP